MGFEQRAFGIGGFTAWEFYHGNTETRRTRRFLSKLYIKGQRPDVLVAVGVAHGIIDDRHQRGVSPDIL